MSNEKQIKKEEIFKLIQKFLKNPPLIIWGSGATIPYGLPSMEDLKVCLKSELGELDKNANLETELEKIRDNSKISKIKQIIRNEILNKDKMCLNESVKDANYFKAIEKMINKFYKAYPHIINIVTTNYDCTLEYALSKYSYSFTDGFTGKVLSQFNSTSFKQKNIVNLIKVHGSLNWFFDENKNTVYLYSENNVNNLEYAMVLPAGNNKYHEVFEEPYRTLITKSDNFIEQANSFLVIGFGFNDKHLTPKIDIKIKNGTPIVIITHKATDSCIKKLNNTQKYCLLEENSKGTKVTFKNKENSEKEEYILDQNYWELNQFMEVL